MAELINENKKPIKMRQDLHIKYKEITSKPKEFFERKN